MMGSDFGAISVETYLRERHDELEKKLEKAQVKVENLETELRKVSRMLDWVRCAAQERAAGAAEAEPQDSIEITSGGRSVSVSPAQLAEASRRSLL